MSNSALRFAALRLSEADAAESTVMGATDWQRTGVKYRRTHAQRWRGFLWSLVYPYQGHRLLLTVPGCVVLAVAVSIGAAAYNTSNNILFIALSLLLACLVFSGLLSWLNLRSLAWRLRVPTPLRAGRNYTATLDVHNHKRLLPTYSVCFEVSSTSENKPLRLPLRTRLDPQSATSLEWTVRPLRRGPYHVDVLTVCSLFPFGFLKKTIGSQLKRTLLVWPAPVEYERVSATVWRQAGSFDRSRKVGEGGDLLALRSYVHGDSQRLVHWKASARLGRLLVRQYDAETQTGYGLWVQTAAAQWPRAEQFERMCSLAATLAEDFFRGGRLVSVAFDNEAPLPVRRRHDLDQFLDRLALVKLDTLMQSATVSTLTAHRAHVLTFAPDGAQGVAAYLNGAKAATA